LRDRSVTALDRARDENAEAIAMYTYWQFIAHRQMLAAHELFSRRGALLGGDLAFSPGRDSAEVWARQHLFDLTRSVGAPPDAFNPRGQRWGLPMPDWERMRAEGWPLLKRRIHRARELYDVIRIDHVVGLFRTFNFGPDKKEDENGNGRFTPADQAGQREQGESILGTIKEAAGPAAIIGEDLGSVPEWVRESMRKVGFPGYKVVRWEKDDSHGLKKGRYANPAEYPVLSVATTGTHDTETMAVWWRISRPDERRNLLESLGLDSGVDGAGGRLDESMLGAILEKLYAAPSILSIEPLQDLFGWDARINHPGTVGPGNWSWRLPATIADLMGNSAIMRQAEKLSAIARRTGRFDEPGA
ncbi:MAG: 4-alpha-glucanotransferase, partial [Candidatus Binataceae bacterium]